MAGSLLSAFAVVGTVHASGLPAPAIPDSVGVNIHFVRGGERDLDLIAAAGIKIVRMDFTWTETERYRGIYDWTAYDELAAQITKRGMRPLFILDYSNPLYEDVVDKLHLKVWPYSETLSPRQAGSVAAFANWAAEAVRHFRKSDPIWEIWNEPNIQFWKPLPDVAAYSRLALAACKQMREADPAATILAPATSGFPWDFLERFFQSGALDCIDGVSVHPYRGANLPPESAAADYQRLQAMIDRFASVGRKGRIPVVSGEWGYSTEISALKPEEQAAFAARQQLFNLLSGLPVSVWYDWKNDGPDPHNGEHNFGLVDTALRPKPAYLALQTLTRELGGFRLVRRLDVGSAQDFVLLFADAAGRGKIVAWTLGR